MLLQCEDKQHFLYKNHLNFYSSVSTHSYRITIIKIYIGTYSITGNSTTLSELLHYKLFVEERAKLCNILKVKSILAVQQ